MRGQIIRRVLAVVGIFITTCAANAGPIREFTFAMQVTGWSGMTVPGVPAMGSILTGLFSYDQGAPPNVNFPGGYVSPVKTFTIDGIASLKPDGGNTIAINNNAGLSWDPLDQFALVADLAGTGFAGYTPARVEFRLRDWDGVADALDSVELPSALDLTKFNDSYVDLTTSGGRLRAIPVRLEQTTDIPEPGTHLRLAVGIAVAALSRRRT